MFGIFYQRDFEKNGLFLCGMYMYLPIYQVSTSHESRRRNWLKFAMKKTRLKFRLKFRRFIRSKRVFDS